MTFAVILLVIIGLVSVAATFIPQWQQAEFYTGKYGDSFGHLIMFLGLDDAYGSLWYRGLFLLLVLSLFFCVVARIKPISQGIRRVGVVGMARKIGSWFLHFGLILIIIFFGLNNYFAYEANIYDVPGNTSRLSGQDILVEFQDFNIHLTDDRFVDQYETKVRFTDLEGNTLDEGSISVNHPMTINGVQFTQASYGYAVDVAVQSSTADFGSAVLYQGDFVIVSDERIAVEMVELYPDYIQTEAGSATASPLLNNPYILYRFYIGNGLADMGLTSASSTVEVDDYTITFSNPQLYSVLAARTDPFLWAVVLGCILLFFGSVLAFFGPEKKTPSLDNPAAAKPAASTSPPPADSAKTAEPPANPTSPTQTKEENHDT